VDDALVSEKVRIERKQFFFDLHENPRGQFLRITEDVKGRRDTIIIPSTGLVEFRDALDRIITGSDEIAGDGSLEVEIEEGPL